jgi:hypothetical protein
MARMATLSLPEPRGGALGGASVAPYSADANVADGGVGTRRCWFSAGDLECSENTGLLSKTPESRELNRARDSVVLLIEEGSGAVK